MIEHFHFLRPAWLLTLLLLVLVLWLLRRRGYDSGNWRAVIDPRLLPHVLSGDAGGRSNRMQWILIVVVALGIVALAGPTWEKREQSVYRQQAALVIALDLSRSMDAADIRPSRLTRARHKIADILRLQTEGQSALLVYAADAFTVVPLTTDVDTILALLPNLETGLMPAQGSRADRALEQAAELFANSGVTRGDLLLVTDGFSDQEVEGLEILLDRHSNLRLSVLAIGTPEGGPVPLKNGNFLKNDAGDIVIVKMDVEGLQRIAERGGGAFTTISADDVDINTLNYVMESRLDAGQAQLSDRSADLWRELGPWLLLLALPLAALAFRRGILWLMPICLLMLPPEADAFDWQALWSNDNQRALQLYREGQYEPAAELFSDADWQAAARYRAGDFAAAAKGWQRPGEAQASYNHATSLAQQGRYDDALAAYDRLLEQYPQHEDASFNRQAIADWLKQQPQQEDQAAGEGEGEPQSEASSQQDEAQQQTGNDSKESSTGADDQPWEQNRQGARSADRPEDSEIDPSQPEAAQAQSAEQPSPAENGQDQDSAEDLANLDQQMSEQAAQQWLRKIPDDPGGLLRRKFLYQYRSRGDSDTEAQPW